MATTLPHRRPDDANASTLPITGNDRDTGHLKAVPRSKGQREQIQRRIVQLCGNLDKSRLLARHEMESHAGSVLAELELPESYLGWTMVTLASAL